MLRTKLAVVISSALLAAAATQAQPAETDQATAAPPAQSSAPSESSAAQDPSTRGNDTVGTQESNVDEHATSGSYYPFSAGTVGDDPAQPKDTSVSANTGDPAAGATNQWKNADTDGDGYLSQDELKKVAPALADNFDEIDVDGNHQLTRDEFRNWHMSQKARMDADQRSTPAASAPAPATPAPAPQEQTVTTPPTGQ